MPACVTLVLLVSKCIKANIGNENNYCLVFKRLEKHTRTALGLCKKTLF